MIPKFPEFKRLEINDRHDVDLFTQTFPPYSDYEYASMWAWDTKGEMMMSLLNENFVVLFTDYATGLPFLSFLGIEKANETAEILLHYTSGKEYASDLGLIPEVTAYALDATRFDIKEDRDHFDYVYTMAYHLDYKVPGLKTVRNSLSAYLRRHPGHKAIELDLNDPQTNKRIEDLYARREQKGGVNIPNETTALKRFLKSAKAFRSIGVGIMFGDLLAAYSISVLLPEGNCNCLFAKGDKSYHGIYALLMHETAKILTSHGCLYMNYEQDLGITNLRRAKLAFHPTSFLKKYMVGQK